MTRATRFRLGAFVMSAFLAAGCMPEADGGTSGTGGSGSGSAGTTGSGTAGSGGSSSGGTGPGSGGTAAGTAGTATGGSATTGTAGTGGASAGAGGGAAGAGGTAAGNAGRGGAGAGGRGGTAAVAGRGGAGGAAGSGSGSGGAAGAGDEYVSGVNVAVAPMVNTILVVTWTQAKAAEQVWLEFSFAGSSVMTSRPLAGGTGAHRDVVLGVPGSTAVTLRIVSKQGGVDYKSRDYMGTTGAVPSGMPVPQISMYDATAASPDRYMFGAVENSPGGCSNRSCYLVGPYWVYIMDRQGRIVWYYSDTTSNAATGFPRIARDGEYIWIEKARTGTRSVHKTTLDRTTFTQTIAVSGLADAIDVTTDGGLLYEVNGDLRELTKAGTTRNIWSCRTAMGANYNCYSNTVNWNPADDTVMLSFPEPNTVVQINRATGALVARYGDASGSYTFMPSTWSFEFQHFPIITPQGTLLVSTHLSAFPEGSSAGANQHAFVEFTIDRAASRLTERWSYTGAYWPLSRGMAIRVGNGNTLVNYGTNGIIQEITPDKRIVFQVKFDLATGNDFYNKLVGHNVLINDLYALNGGGPK